LGSLSLPARRLMRQLRESCCVVDAVCGDFDVSSPLRCSHPGSTACRMRVVHGRAGVDVVSKCLEERRESKGVCHLCELQAHGLNDFTVCRTISRNVTARVNLRDPAHLGIRLRLKRGRKKGRREGQRFETTRTGRVEKRQRPIAKDDSRGGLCVEFNDWKA